MFRRWLPQNNPDTSTSYLLICLLRRTPFQHVGKLQLAKVAVRCHKKPIGLSSAFKWRRIVLQRISEAIQLLGFTRVLRLIKTERAALGLFLEPKSGRSSASWALQT